MNHRTLASVVAVALCAGALPAQMSGPFVINPAGGTGQFRTFTEAVNALFVNGINGPVELVVLAGTYTESVLVPPINGSSPANTITFRSAVGPGSVLVNGSAGDTFALLGVSFLHNSSLVWDGIDFVGAPGHAISGTMFCEDMEIRNCTFSPNHRSNAAGDWRHLLIASENSGNDLGWRIHHNHMTVPSRQSRTAYGIYESNGGGWEIHHNSIDLNGCDHGLYLINNNTQLDSIYDNLIYGALAPNGGNYAAGVSAISVDVSNFNNDITHNTFAVLIPSSGCIIATAGYNFGSGTVENQMYGNVFMLLGGGTCISSETYQNPPQYFFQSNGNVFFAPGGEIGRLGPSNPGVTTLAAWQAASGQDLNSVEADPQLVNPAGSPPDLHPASTSPVRDAAVNTPGYVVDDYDGRLRDAAPDAGAYETSSFAIYGRGCAGTGGLVPAIGHSGTVALGSNNFTIDVSQANASSLAILFGGTSRTAYQALTLPYSLGGGCSVQAAPETTVIQFTTPGGTASVLIPIPNLASLAGMSLFFQWAVVDPASGSSFGITTSNGGALQL